MKITKSPTLSEGPWVAKISRINQNAINMICNDDLVYNIPNWKFEMLQHCCLLLAPVSDETPDSPRLTLEKTSCSKSAAETTRNRTEDFCVIRWSKPSRDYIMNFYRPKEVPCKKTESGEHTRCPRGRGRAQGVGRALQPRGSLVSFPVWFLFSYFSKYSKTEKNCH